MTIETISLEFKIKSFRKVPNPYYLNEEEPLKSADMYFVICDIKDVPLDIPMQTNPREQNLNLSAAKKIKNSLVDPANRDFYLLNRGLLLSANNIVFNSKKDTVIIEFTDINVHGNIDGGHTYKIIKEYQQDLDYGQQYVKIEILTGVEDIFQKLASARNTSTQVQDKSIAELEKRFEIIKKALQNEPFYEEIYFKENDSGSIDVTDILSILNLFNIAKYSGINEHPIISYSGKKQCIDTYINAHKKDGNDLENPYVKMTNIIIDVFKLYDQLETKARDYYSKYITRGKYGSIIGVIKRKDGKPYFKSKFYKKDMEYITPNGFLYPILGAFRSLLEIKDGYYVWKKNPMEVLDKIGPELIGNTIDMSRELGNNPQSAGKNKTLWKNLYMCVLMETMSSMTDINNS